MSPSGVIIVCNILNWRIADELVRIVVFPLKNNKYELCVRARPDST
jgi:hypothetical protein